MDRRWGLGLVSMLATIGLVAVGCGSDDDGAAEVGGDVSQFSAAGPAVDEAVSAEEPDPEAVEAALVTAEAAAPESLADEVAVAAAALREVMETGDGSVLDSDEVQTALAAMDDFYISDCGFSEVSLSAVDYAFEGVPSSVESGDAILKLTNEGTELHEALVFRFNDDVDLSAEEILMLPEEEGIEMVTELGGPFAFPGDAGSATLSLTEPGRYMIVCFIPLGLTPEAFAAMQETGAEPEGAPHFTEGMFAEFEVN